MNSFIKWAMGEHQKTNFDRKRGTKLLQISDRIDWMKIRTPLEKMYSSKSNRDASPNHDVIMMFKVLILQQWYGLSDMETERQIADRISFMEFLGYPETIPDSRTICIFRELMAESGTDKIVWNELQNQLDAMRLKVKRGTAQDATFIKKEDPGTAKKPRGSDAKSQRSKDDT